MIERFDGSRDIEVHSSREQLRVLRLTAEQKQARLEKIERREKIERILWICVWLLIVITFMMLGV